MIVGIAKSVKYFTNTDSYLQNLLILAVTDHSTKLSVQYYAQVGLQVIWILLIIFTIL